MSVYVKTSKGAVPIVDLQQLSHRNYIFIGDSWMTGMSLSNSNVRYLSKLKDMLSKYDSKSLFYESSKGGSGFTVQGNTFLSLLEHAYDEITGSAKTDIQDPLSVTDIVVLGGLNDKSSSTSSISIVIAQFIYYARSKFPNAVVRIGCIGRSTYFSDNWNVYCNVYRAYHDAAINNGGTYIDGSEWCMHYYNALQADYYHPDENGHELIAQFLFQYLTTGKGSYNSPLYAVGNMYNLFSGSEGNRPSVKTTFYTFQQDGMITFQNVGITAINDCNAGLNLVSGQNRTVLNCYVDTLGYYSGAIDNEDWNATHTQVLVGYDNGSSWINVDAEVCPICNPVNSEFRLKCRIFHPTGNTLNNVTTFQIYPFIITTPWYLC